jgi:GAF domain-containing protein
MTGHVDRLAQVRALVEEEDRSVGDKPAIVGRMQRLCRAAARTLPAAGVGISLIAEPGSQVTVAASGDMTEQLEEFQFALGEGPCRDAHATRRPVLNSDLQVADGRWPGYARAVGELGVRAVFAFPLQVGAARMGAMDVYRCEVGGLSEEELAQALTFAEIATSDLLHHQLQPGEGDEVLRDAVDNRYEVYQAQGMVMVQLGVDLAEAMVRIRGHAYVENRRLGDVAGDIVAGRLALEGDGP